MLYSSLIHLLLLSCLFSFTTAYDHVNRKDYKVVLTNGYEDGTVGVHLKNKKQQDRAMKQFMSGNLAAGEMGCGIELQDINTFTLHNFCSTCQCKYHR